MSYREYMRRCEREYLAALMVKHNGKVALAAQEAGLHRTYMYEALRRHGLEPPRTGTGRRTVDLVLQ